MIQIHKLIVKTLRIFFKVLFVCMVLSSQNSLGQLETQARTKITNLETLITEAENNSLDVLKEKMTIRVAEVFLKYANWDEDNVSKNKTLFASLPFYENNAQQLAQDLPDFERSEILMMLDEAILTTQNLINGKIVRKQIPNVNWADITIDGSKILHKDTPVFLTDYTWKPFVSELTEFFGARDGFFLSPTHIKDANGNMQSWVINDLNTKATGTFGSVFINHRDTPDWAEQNYGPEFRMREDTFIAYDIDNPGAREMFSTLFENTVPKMIGKKYTQLGYMLANEPHFITSKEPNKDVWATGPVSEHTRVKFRTWLKQKHTSITKLNVLWNTNFPDFESIAIDIPMFRSLQGTPKWYDWQRFNMDRVNDYFLFLRDEIKKYDPQAKTHIKLIPRFWVQNQGDHGLDIETLTRQSDIIGNDAKAYNSYMWGGKQDWEDRYNFEWKDIALSYDFFKSIGPDKIMYNSETHFLSTTQFRDLYLKPSYARMVYWLAYLHGLDVDQCWFWSRRENGEPRSNMVAKDYPGSINQQPRIINEVTSTMMDLSSYGKEITQIQNLRKPIRIYNTQTTAINVGETYMKNTYKLYESLYFEGLQLGFATKDIINIEDNSTWDVVLIADTEYVTEAEIEALQSYLDKGGYVIVDAISLKKDEYGQLHTKTLNVGNGTLLNVSNIQQMKDRALEIIETKNRFPNLTVEETNGTGFKGCHWRAITTEDGRDIISLVNVGKTDANIALKFRGNQHSVICRDLLDGNTFSGDFIMNPEQVLFLEVNPLSNNQTDYTLTAFGESCPNTNNGKLEIEANTTGNYELILDGIKTSFQKTLVIENLEPKTYEFCIINIDKAQEQCYSIKIEASPQIEAKFTNSKNALNISIISGTAPYVVLVNSKEVLTTLSSNFNIPIHPGDVVELATNAKCEGKLKKHFSDLISIYPNPTKGVFQINLGHDVKNVEVCLYDVHGRLVEIKTKDTVNNTINLDVSPLIKGIYFVKISSKNKTLKLIKR